MTDHQGKCSAAARLAGLRLRNPGLRPASRCRRRPTSDRPAESPGSIPGPDARLLPLCAVASLDFCFFSGTHGVVGGVNGFCCCNNGPAAASQLFWPPSDWTRAGPTRASPSRSCLCSVAWVCLGRAGRRDGRTAIVPTRMMPGPASPAVNGRARLGWARKGPVSTRRSARVCGGLQSGWPVGICADAETPLGRSGPMGGTPLPHQRVAPYRRGAYQIEPRRKKCASPRRRKYQIAPRRKKCASPRRRKYQIAPIRCQKT